MALGYGAAAARELPELPPDGTPVVEVDVRGTIRTSPDRIRQAMELKAGTPFSAAALRRDQQAIANLGQYNPLGIAIRAEETEEPPGGLRLVVNVEENPTVGRIRFVGNVKYSAERLRRELDFAEGDILPLAARATTAASLRGFYAQGGYRSARIRVNVEPAEEPDTVDLLIVVDEGERIRIRSLIIDGNRHFPDWRIRLWAMNSGSWLFFRNYYDDRMFDDDLRRVEQEYRDAGFLDATARRGEFEYEEDRAVVSPRMVVTEGPRYRVAGYEITGHTLFTDDEVRAPFRTLVGKNYHGRRFREALDRLKRLYGDQGYVNTIFSGDFVKDAERAEVVLTIQIEESDPVYVGHVYIQKDDYDYEFDLNWLERFIDWSSPGVKESTIMREVQFEPGAKYRTVDEVRTRDRLRNLGFFREVAVRREPTADPNVDDVIVAVEEDPSAGFIALTAGVGEVSGPAISAQYINPNLFGEARVFRVGATVGSRVRSFSVGYLDRYFMDTENSLELALYRDYAIYRGIGQRIYGGTAEVGHPFTDSLTGYMRFRLETVRLERRDDDLREDVRSYSVYAVRGLLVRDMRNNRRWTTEGYLVSAGVEPGQARRTMLKLLHGAEWYKAIDREQNWVYAYSHNVGLHPYDSQRIGISERYFLGGTNSLRGFAPRGMGPRDPGARRVHVGGSTAVAQRHELRHRFSRLFQARLFTDAGMLERDFLEFGSPRVGSGAGVTFDLGAFALDLDLARAMVKRRHDRTQVLHFRLRSNF